LAPGANPPAAATITPPEATPRTPSGPVTEGCLPTEEDGAGPNYVAGAPERSAVGEGYVLSGSVLAAGTCRPLAGATVEFWMAGPDGVYSDDFRGVTATDSGGGFAIESHLPPVYDGRASHIHLLVGAPGHLPVFLVHYPRDGESAGQMAVVLAPE
jgi:protocatechuate 3,4-dioxygenase beta subunit